MNQAGLIDTHAHVMDAAFDADRDAVFLRAHQAGVTRMLLVGYDRPSSQAAVALARTTPGCWAAVGIHPNSAAEASDADFEAIAALASEPEVVAIGETGLDTYRQFTPAARQRQAFEWHLRLAEERGLPVVIHNRQADSDVLTMVTSSRATGILHCFSSTDPSYLDRMLNAGCWVSFAGPLTFKNAADLRAMAVRVPHARLLVETDCPYLAPEPHRGRRNEPAFVRDTAACLANLLNTPFEVLVEMLWRNSLCAFPALAPELQALA